MSRESLGKSRECVDPTTNSAPLPTWLQYYLRANVSSPNFYPHQFRPSTKSGLQLNLPTPTWSHYQRDATAYSTHANSVPLVTRPHYQLVPGKIYPCHLGPTTNTAPLLNLPMSTWPHYQRGLTAYRLLYPCQLCQTTNLANC